MGEGFLQAWRGYDGGADLEHLDGFELLFETAPGHLYCFTAEGEGGIALCGRGRPPFRLAFLALGLAFLDAHCGSAEEAASHLRVIRPGERSFGLRHGFDFAASHFT